MLWSASSRQPRSMAAFVAGAVLLPGLLAVVPSFGQDLSGRWAWSGRTLDNGDKEKYVLELTRQGDALEGRLTALGWSNPIRGMVKGGAFELYWASETPERFGGGRWVNGQLVGTMLDDPHWVAKPATAGDEIAKPPRIAPPPLSTVAGNGLAKTPPMGWNSWNLFAGKIDDATVRAMADAMVASGMRDAGYVYINIDDTWQGQRDTTGNLQPNHKFPDMRALADYVHSKGLKLGIYSSPGPRTCGGYPGSYGHEEQDARSFAAWQIDYLKYDWCSAAMVYPDADLRPVYQKMGAALEATGRPMVYSLCEYGHGKVETWGAQVGGNLWRTTGDIRDTWSSMLGNVEQQIPTAPAAGPGHWNDPDMLEVGNGHMTNEEYRTHMSLWALVAAPLLAGNDIRSMSPAIRDVLMNKEVIEVDQDPLGRQAVPAKHGDLQMWVKPLADGGVAIGVLNRGESAASAAVRSSDLHLGTVTRVRDLWQHRDLKLEGTYRASIPAHGVLMLRFFAGRRA